MQPDLLRASAALRSPEASGGRTTWPLSRLYLAACAPGRRREPSPPVVPAPEAPGGRVARLSSIQRSFGRRLRALRIANRKHP